MSISSAHCSALISYIISSKIKYIIGSPGARNFPLLSAFERNENLELNMIVDERSAAFTALGIASIKMSPVAICCTSGSAMLNLSPAVAEAYYRNIPLLVVTADRPIECLDNGEAQMINQLLPLKGLTSEIIDILPQDCESDVIEKCNFALTTLINTCRPVQLNVRFSEPMSVATKNDITNLNLRLPEIVIENNCLSTIEITELSNKLSKTDKVLIYVGQCMPDVTFSKAIDTLSKRSNIVVIAETISNLKNCPNVIYGIERILKQFGNENVKQFIPDILISIGGSPTGRLFREFIATNFSGDVWRIGFASEQNNFYNKRVHNVVGSKSKIIAQLSDNLSDLKLNSDFSQLWHSIETPSLSCEADVVNRLLKAIPIDANIVLSNGLTVRHAVLINPSHNRYECNRGVNGIDGSTSTAIGASWAYSGKTVLLTGDMSACYDMSAWFNHLISDRFKVIVFDNSGGGIFRNLPIIGRQPECETLACCSQMKNPLAEIAKMCNFELYTIDCSGNLDAVVERMYESNKPAMLIVKMLNE